MTQIIAALILLMMGSCGFAASYRYELKVDAAMSTMNVKLCASGAALHRLVSPEPDTHEWTKDVTLKQYGRNKKLSATENGIKLPAPVKNACLTYKIVLSKIDDPSRIRKAQDAHLVSPSVFLWYPKGLKKNDQLFARFKLPDNLDVATPWNNSPTRMASPNKGWTARLNIPNTPTDWPGKIVFLSANPPDTTPVLPPYFARLTFINIKTASRQQRIRDWLSHAAKAIKSAYGEFPLYQPRIVVIHDPKLKHAVHWGEVQRGHGAAVFFYVNLNKPQSEFLSDWTAAHELSHLFLPFVNRRDAWFSEGLATYYQNLLRARTGQYTEQQAWQKMLEGFQRGIKQTNGSQYTLKEATRRMHRDRAYMRVYWSGTAIMFIGDMQLREQTNGKHSLDSALRHIKKCCLNSYRSWTALELMQKLDNVTGEKIFVPLHKQYVNSKVFPDYEPYLKKLGIRFQRGKVRFDSSKQTSMTRKKLTGKPAN
jgi:hypothetical protein